jgi:signal transduction histidine kinase
MPRSQPLSVRWWLGIFAAAVALPLVLVVWTFVSEVEAAKDEARELSLRVARATAARLRTNHVDALALLDRMAARPSLRDDRGNCDPLFSLIGSFPKYADLFYLDHGCHRLCEAAREPDLSSDALQWVQGELAAGRLRPGIPLVRVFRGVWLSVLARPVASVIANSRGMLVLVQLPELAGLEALPPDSVITILDRNATVVVRSGDQGGKWAGRNAANAEFAALGRRRAEGSAEAKGLDGVSRQYGFAPIAEMGWTVYVGVPTAMVKEPVRELVLRLLAGGGAVLLLVLIVALTQMRVLGRRIESVGSQADSVARGDSAESLAGARAPRELLRVTRALSQISVHRSESERKLKALSDRLLVAQERERTRIARELHDDLGQSLTALKMDVIGLVGKAPPSALRTRILETLDSMVTAVQRISSELRPSVLDDLGLAAAIESEADVFTQRTGIECELSLPAAAAVDLIRGTAIFRIVQEALTNVARHSNATRVEVRLTEGAGELLLEVKDDGRGATADEINGSGSLGLIGIRERAELIGGIVAIRGVAGQGTRVTVRLPETA